MEKRQRSRSEREEGAMMRGGEEIKGFGRLLGRMMGQSGGTNGASREEDVACSSFLDGIGSEENGGNDLDDGLMAEVEVERLDQLKASRMKEIALKRQTELEEIFDHAHSDIDLEAAQEKIMALIDSRNVDPSELLADMDNQIIKAKEETLSRKEILDEVEKWMF
ncbi:65-kDa microtubule-associated protein 1 [Camellia lanceoleosa]|uniref:65-kDa microtubule-associated protein 1 n=1 Tax=Camellia lanceoleosa TaxID=1840588 RepID=A0ACC0HDW8_9ERIC|nr:65-kDa microtubule-associated protein 1 [Camellia lanceoleosa]